MTRVNLVILVKILKERKMSEKYEGLVELAIFESTGAYPYRLIYTPEEAKVSGFARVSAWVEVEFPSRASEEIIPEKVNAIEKEIAETWKDAKEKVDRLTSRKAELLAITDGRVFDPNAPLDDLRID